MVLNKKSQVLLTGIMVCILVFIVAVILITPIKEVVVTARGQAYLDCTNTTISTGQRMTCILVDLYLFYFTGMVIALGLGYLGWRRMTSVPQY